jgi:hypothetical protein
MEVMRVREDDVDRVSEVPSLRAGVGRVHFAKVSEVFQAPRLNLGTGAITERHDLSHGGPKACNGVSVQHAGSG